MTLNKILRGIVLAGLFVLPFIPFVVWESFFFPFVVGKAFIFRMLVEVVLGAWLILALRDVAYRPKHSWVLGAATLFLLVVGVANVFGVNPDHSLWSNFERMEGYITILHAIALALVAGSVLTKEKLWTRFFQTSFAASIVMAIYGLVQSTGGVAITTIGGSSRIDGTFGNPIYVAGYLLIHIFIAFFLFGRSQHTWQKWLYGLGIALEMYVLLQTETRGSMLGVIGGIVLAALLVAIFEKTRPKIRKVAIGALLGLVVLSGLFVALKDTAIVQDTPLRRLTTISPSEGTGRARLIVWSMALEGFQEKPLLGWGQDNFNVVFNQYYKPEMYEYETWYDHAHNAPLDWLVAGGILSLLSYLALFIAALYALFRTKKLTITEKSIFTGLLAGYFVHNLFVFDTTSSYVFFAFLLGYFHFLETDDKETRVLGQLSLSPVWRNVGAGLVAVLTIAALYIVNVPSMQASRTLVQALGLRNAGRLEESHETFEKALAYNAPIGRQEIREQLLMSAASMRTSEEVPTEVKADFFALTLTEMQQQIEEEATDARTQLFFGDFLTKFGQYELAEEHLEQALALSPEKQNTRYVFAQNALVQEKFDEAVSHAQTAYESEKTNDQALSIYLRVLEQAGRIDEARAVLEEARDIKPAREEMVETELERLQSL